MEIEIIKNIGLNTIKILFFRLLITLSIITYISLDFYRYHGGLYGIISTIFIFSCIFIPWLLLRSPLLLSLKKYGMTYEEYKRISDKILEDK